MKIELDKKQIDEVTQKHIQALEKEVKSLERKLSSREGTIKKLRERRDFSKDMRDSVIAHSESLVELLENGEWLEYDRHGSGW